MQKKKKILASWIQQKKKKLIDQSRSCRPLPWGKRQINTCDTPLKQNPRLQLAWSWLETFLTSSKELGLWKTNTGNQVWTETKMGRRRVDSSQGQFRMGIREMQINTGKTLLHSKHSDYRRENKRSKCWWACASRISRPCPTAEGWAWIRRQWKVLWRFLGT